MHGLSFHTPTPEMETLSGLGIEPVSLALAGRFLTTGPPGKSLYVPSVALDFVSNCCEDALCFGGSL